MYEKIKAILESVGIYDFESGKYSLHRIKTLIAPY